MSHQKDESSARRPLPVKVWAALVGAFLIFLLTTGVIYYRYMTTPETNCTLVVAGNYTLDGYSVVVERMSRDGLKTKSWRDALDKENQYSARFFLHSGTYKVELWNTAEQCLLSQSEFIPPGTRLTIDLNRLYPATRPANQQVRSRSH